jgi:glycosyltransferase involved in cell wall biosynthesis
VSERSIDESSNVPRIKVFILYPYYWPHFKAGGPIQSLFNLVSLFSQSAQFFVVSNDMDIDGTYSDVEIEREKWVIGPNHEQIFFAAKINVFLILKLISAVKPSILFINGIFNFQTTIAGLIANRLFGYKIIISPRGMLQPWALKKKALKKKIYLSFIRTLVTPKTVWHATDENESKHISEAFDSSSSIFTAPNIPRRVGKYSQLSFPKNDKIRLIFLSLINTNKNLHLVIEAVNSNPQFMLDIVGPIADQQYWDLCNELIVDDRIKYKGSIPSWAVPAMLKDYHFFVLPTLGENFGHAIFDALASGVPVLTSRNTPWRDIEKSECGFYIELDDPRSITKILVEISKMNNEKHQLYRLNSFNYAQTYWAQSDYYSQYKFLIG